MDGILNQMTGRECLHPHNLLILTDQQVQKQYHLRLVTLVLIHHYFNS